MLAKGALDSLAIEDAATKELRHFDAGLPGFLRRRQMAERSATWKSYLPSASILGMLSTQIGAGHRTGDKLSHEEGEEP